MEKHETKAQEVVTQRVSFDVGNGRDTYRGGANPGKEQGQR